MLYTAPLSVVKKLERKMKCYYVMRGHGNDDVAPDKHDLDMYERGDLTWRGLVINFQQKLTRAEAYEWMSHVSAEAVREDIVLVDSTEDGEHAVRMVLAKMMGNLFSGHLDFRYAGEIR